MRYEDFVIRIGPQMGEAYHVRVEQSPAGEGKSTLELPFDMSAMGGMLGGLARTVRGASTTMEAEASQEEQTLRAVKRVDEQPFSAPREVGQQLYDALFQGDVQNRFLSSMGILEGKAHGDSGERYGLRIRLKMDLNEPGIAEVASLPWEFLYPGPERGFLNTSESTPIIRSLDVGRPTQPYPFRAPLRILVVIANPEGSDDLDLTEEREAIESSWGDLEGVDVDFLEKATLQELRKKLGETDYHVFHFMGHGDFDRDSNRGVLLFDDGRGGVELVDSDTLQMMLRDESLRLVFLNACKTAVTGRHEDVDPFAGVATSLIRAGISALVAMQFPITDPAAIVFSKTFYERIAAGDPVDIAMVEGRKAITAADAKTMEWATPVLFMRSRDGVLFEHEQTDDDSQKEDSREADPVADDPEREDKPETVAQKEDPTRSNDEDETRREEDEIGKDIPSNDRRERAKRVPKSLVLAGGAAVVVLAVVAGIALWPRTPTPTALSFDSPPTEVVQGASVPIVLSLRAENGDDIDDPGHLSNYDVVWEATPPSLGSLVSQVDSARSRLVGVLTAGRPGTVTVTATLGDGLRDEQRIGITLSSDSLARAMIQKDGAENLFSGSGASDEEVQAAYAELASRFDYALGEGGMEGVGERASALLGLVSAFADAESAVSGDELTLHERRAQWENFSSQARAVRPQSPSIETAQERIQEIEGVGRSFATLQARPELGVCRGGLCNVASSPGAVLNRNDPMSPGHVSVTARFATPGTVTWRLLKDGREIGTHSLRVPGDNERRVVNTNDSRDYSPGPLTERGTYEVRLHNDNGGRLGDVIGRAVFCITSCS